MEMARAAELSRDLSRFIAEVESQPLNGIVGNIRNYSAVDAGDLMNRMVHLAREDVQALIR